MNFIFTLLIALLFFSCSSSGSKQKIKTRLVGGALLPESVDVFLNMKQDDTIEYEIASFKAATDLVNLGKMHMKAFNSGDALRYLSLGAHLLPYRGDIQALYRKAINNYIKVTNQMAENDSIECIKLNNRIAFLEKVSPDSLVNINKRNLNCQYNEKESKTFSFQEIARYKQEKPKIKYEQHADINLSQDLDYLLKMREYLPIMEIMTTSLEGLGMLQIDSKKIRLSSYTKDTQNIYIEVEAEINDQESNGESAIDTCRKFKNLLNIEGENYKGPKLKCAYDWGRMGEISLDINVSPKVIDLTSNAHSVIPFRYISSLVPPVLIFNVEFEYRNGKVKNYKYLSINEMSFYYWENLREEGIRNRNITFIPYQKHNQPQRSVTYDHDFSRLYKYYKQKDIYSPRIRREVNDKIKSDFRFQMPAISFSSKKHKRTSPKFIIRRLKRSDIEGLASVKIKLDRNETYKLWRKEIKNQGFY